MLKRSTKGLRRILIPLQGPRTKEWKVFRNAKLIKDRNEEGLILCQDYLVGLPRCGVSVPSPDLHHIEGRDGKLLLDESKMVWLIRTCHEKVHGG